MTKVVIVGAGKGGRALLEMFSGDPTVTIVGVVDVNPWAPGLELARRLNVQVSTDLRESGALEQDADVILFLYRPERYGLQSEDGDRVADVVIGKQRNGPTGKVQVTFIPEYASFERLAKREAQPF